MTFCLGGILSCGILSEWLFILWHFVWVAFCPWHFVQWHFVLWHYVRQPFGKRKSKYAFLKINWQSFPSNDQKNQAGKKSYFSNWSRDPSVQVCDIMTSSFSKKNLKKLILRIWSHMVAKMFKIEKASKINLSTTSNTLLTMALTKVTHTYATSQ